LQEHDYLDGESHFSQRLSQSEQEETKTKDAPQFKEKERKQLDGESLFSERMSENETESR
jgi:hypothetical protein